MPGQVLASVDFSPEGYGSAPIETDDIRLANLITSKVDQGEVVVDTPKHKIVLDVDMPVRVIASSTPGHFHLFIDKVVTWEEYTRLLDVLADVGIVEHGYVNFSKERGYTAVRLPWIKKQRASGSQGKGSR